MIEALLFLTAPIFVPALILIFVPAAGRRFFLGFGLLVALIAMLTVSPGPHNPLTLLPLLGFGIALGALVAELVVFFWRRRQVAGGSAQ
jgi:hypothetical protein